MAKKKSKEPRIYSLQKAPMLAMRNRIEVETASECGCYYCQKIFRSEEIKEWTDNSQTALCPYCSVDSVLAGMNVAEELAKLHKYWFAEPKD